MATDKTTRTDREHDAARYLFEEGLRLADVAAGHRSKMLREVSYPADVARDDANVNAYGADQRGNAGAFAHCEGMALGMADALRALGFTQYADRIAHALDCELGASCVSREPADD